jgi:lipopolysaccharide/colanic/teichoic acid biosynthesis glycosyltransferase
MLGAEVGRVEAKKQEADIPIGWDGAADAVLSDALKGIPPIVASQLGWVLGFAAEHQRDRRAYERARYLGDLTLIGLTLPFWLLLLGIFCLLVKLESSPDPIIYRSWRTGRDGRRFEMYKIRTMVRDADELLPTVIHLNQRSWPEIKIPNDPRVTKLGHFLRRTHLDELPQLFNVIRGDMSLVGPRPTAASIECYEPWHRDRLRMKPGLTGLWQIVQRDVNQFDVRVRLDILYIDRCCWLLDLWILLRTAGLVLAAGRPVRARRRA